MEPSRGINLAPTSSFDSWCMDISTFPSGTTTGHTPAPNVKHISASFIYLGSFDRPAMAKEKMGAGFQSAAGLIRYFDAEDETALKIPPYAIIAMMVATIVLIYVFGVLYPV